VWVSNYGDSSLSLIQLNPYKEIKTIQNVPGSRGLHGIAFDYPSTDRPRAWVAGTDADVVTLVDTTTATVLTSFPVRRPTAVAQSSSSDAYVFVAVASSVDNSIFFVLSNLVTWSIQTNVPTPQDFVSSALGYIASTGPGNSLWINGSLTPGIPGAAGVAAGGATITRNYPGPPPFALVTSPDSNSLFLVQWQPSRPHEFSVADGAAFSTLQVAPGSLASAFAAVGANQNFVASSLPLPKTLGGAAVRAGGTLSLDTASAKWVYSPAGAAEAGLLFVGPSQINFQIPPGLAPAGSVPIQLTRPDGGTYLTTIGLGLTAPGIFTLGMNGRGQGAVLNQDNTVNFGTNPARRGSVIQIFATGAGDTTPALGAGEAAPVSGNPLVLTKVQPTVTIGGKNAKVQFSGMAPGFVGLWQINAEIPQDVTPGMAVPLAITAAGAQSNTVTIAVQ
jgi:uncharacterized protein (TIGR03437 family)